MTEHYRLALLRVVAGLFVSAGITADAPMVQKLPRHVRNAVLKVLRPAESAARRLVVMEARKLDEVAYVPPRPRAVKSTKVREKTGTRLPRFRLVDPRKVYEELHPNRRKPQRKPRRERSTEPQIQVRIAGFDGQPDFIIWSEPKAVPMAGDEITATAICRRLLALKLALDDLPKQAQRLVREIAKRKQAPPGPKSVPPLRFGLPPGYRQRHIHEVDGILWECHCLVRRAPSPDTS